MQPTRTLLRGKVALGLVACAFVVTCVNGCGCSGRKPVRPVAEELREEPSVRKDEVKHVEVPVPPAVEPATLRPETPPVLAQLPEVEAPEVTPQQRYDGAFLEGLNHLGQRKYTDALGALERARGVQDTEQVRAEIDRVKGLIALGEAAQRTVQDIQVVLDAGKPDEAARLASSALEQYADTEAAAALGRLKRQADTLMAARLTDDVARKALFRKEAQDALAAKNLRGAALALEKALEQGEDAELRKQYDEVRGNLARYDDHRRHAAELRQDPAHLEEAIAALREAAKIWDTLQVQQDLNEYSLALQKRRDRIGVADFEVRGEVGVPFFGRTIGEELLPHFKTRFDLVERGQLGKVLEELRIDADALADDENGRRELGRLAKLRFLVLGSVTRLGGVTVNARLIDVATGLVVQTAKVVAASPEEVPAALPRLAAILQMTDDQKAAYEERLARAAAAVQVVAASPLNRLPPPPDVPAPGRPLPPVLVPQTPLAPPLGTIRVEDFDRLPPPPPPGALPPAPVLPPDREEAIKQRLLGVAVELGDNLFLRGNYREAQPYFDLALTLYPGQEPLLIRADRCRQHAPNQTGIDFRVGRRPRPRLAVLDFVVSGVPFGLPPRPGAWAAETITSYFSSAYDVIERGELFWYMGRLGLSVADLRNDAAARRWLGRALHLRAFAFGTIRRTPGLELTVHLVDAEYGFEQGAGRVRVADPKDLKPRLDELARLALMEPAARVRFEKEEDTYRSLLKDGTSHFDAGRFDRAAEVYQNALKVRPGSIEVLVLLNRARDRAAQAELDARLRESQREKELAAWRKRQWELSVEAEAARVRARQDAEKQKDQDRKQQQEQRDKAYAALLVQARLAMTQQNFPKAIQLFEGARDLKPDDTVARELAQARVRADEAARAAAQAEAQRKAAEQQRKLEEVRALLDKERQRTEAEAKARRDKDEAEHKRLVELARKAMADKKYDDAVSALQSARQLSKTDEVESLLAQASEARTLAQKDAAARAELEKRLAQLREARARADAEAKRKQQSHDQLVQQARKAMADKQYEQAATKFQEAVQLIRTDAVMGELRQAREAADKQAAAAAEAKQKQEAEQKQAARLQQLIKDGKAALTAKEYDKAVKAFAEAKTLAPRDIDALFGYDLAVQGRDRELARQRLEAQEKERTDKVRKLLDSAKIHLAAKRYPLAELALNEAARLDPANTEVKAALDKVKAEQKAVAQDPAAKKRAEDFQRALTDGEQALRSKQYYTAIKALQDALKLIPDEPRATALLKDAQAGQAAEDTRRADQAKQQKEALDRATQVEKLLTRGRTALATRDLRAAADAIGEAARLSPNSGAVQQAQKALAQAQDDDRREAQARAQAAARKAQEDQARRADYTRLLGQGQAALKGKRFQEAVTHFTAALKLVPGDREADAGLKAAQDGLKAPAPEPAKPVAEVKKPAPEVKKPTPEPAKPAPEPKKPTPDTKAADYQKAMDAAAAAEKQQRFADALKSYGEALRLMPRDPKATAGLRSAELGMHVVEGKKAIAAKRWADAAKEFDAALKLDPNNADAKKGAQQAKDRKP